MPHTAAFLLDQAQAGSHVQFIYDLAAQRITFVNAAYEHVFQGQCAAVNAELPGLLARLHPDDRAFCQAYWRLWQQGRMPDEAEFRLLGPGREVQWFCLTPHWQRDAAGRVWLGGTLADISAAKRHQENAAKFNTKKNTVLEMVSHDLAGAFVLVQQLLGHVEQEMSPQPNLQVPEMLRLIRQTCEQGVGLIHGLINQELQESAEVDLKYERLDLAERVAQILEPYRRVPGYVTQHLTYEATDGPVYAEVDANKLMQVVSNLLHNAFKFTPPAGGIAVKVAPCEGCVRISVADEGIGIPAPLLPQLFERFTPARRPGLRGEPTTGLGLWLCKTIVELHHGTLTVASREGHGTTFTVELPLFQTSAMRQEVSA